MQNNIFNERTQRAALLTQQSAIFSYKSCVGTTIAWSARLAAVAGCLFGIVTLVQEANENPCHATADATVSCNKVTGITTALLGGITISAVVLCVFEGCIFSIMSSIKRGQNLREPTDDIEMQPVPVQAI
jgi:hypothetical protein